MFVFALVNISNISPFISNGKSEVLPTWNAADFRCLNGISFTQNVSEC